MHNEKTLADILCEEIQKEKQMKDIYRNGEMKGGEMHKSERKRGEIVLETASVRE